MEGFEDIEAWQPARDSDCKVYGPGKEGTVSGRKVTLSGAQRTRRAGAAGALALRGHWRRV